MAECANCGEEYSDKRLELGYENCLACGAKEAKIEANEKAKRVAVAFNKGGLQYITPGTDLSTLGKK